MAGASSANAGCSGMRARRSATGRLGWLARLRRRPAMSESDAVELVAPHCRIIGALLRVAGSAAPRELYVWIHKQYRQEDCRWGDFSKPKLDYRTTLRSNTSRLKD